MKAIVPICLIFAVVWIYPAADISDPRYSAYYRFGMCVFAILCYLIWRMNKWAAMFLILCGVSSVFPFSSKYSKNAMTAVCCGAFLYWFVSNLTQEQVELVLNAICIVAVLNCIMLVSQELGFDPVFNPKNGGDIPPTVGLLSNKNEVSAYLAFSIPAMIRGRWRYLIPFAILGLYISSSTGGILAAGVSLTAYFVIKDGLSAFIKRWQIILGMWVVLILSIHISDPLLGVSGKLAESITYRWDVWVKGFKMFLQHPIVGCGIGHWKVVWIKFINDTGWWKQAHNEYLQAIFEMGFLALVFMVGYFVRIVKKYKKEAILPATAIIAIAVNSFVNFPFHIAQTAFLALIWMGLYEAITNESKLPALQNV